jgi:hypothetical protein
LSLLFVVFALFLNSLNVHASGVGASGSFAGTNYQVKPGNDLINTGTDFSFINNFSTPITVEFIFEAPTGVSVNVPDDPVVIAGGAMYRFDVNIFTTASAQEGTFSLRIVGRVIPDTVSGVEVSGSAGLNASITLQGDAATTPPTLSIHNATETGFTLRVFNSDPFPVNATWSINTSPPQFANVVIDSQKFLEVVFINLDTNTTYTIRASSATTPERGESSEVTIQATTLAPSIPDPDPTTPTPPPPTVAPTPPSGGGGPRLTPFLIIEFNEQEIVVPVYGQYTPPAMTAFVSLRDNVRETQRIDLTNQVVITGSVNPNALGRYEIRYFLRYNTLSIEEVVVVFVRDITPPRILSAAELTFKVDDPFVYELVATDNYDRPEDLIVTGLPAVVDTTVVGPQRFGVIVSDQSGNRTPFLFTVNVRERLITPIPLRIEEIDVVLEAVEGYFDETNYRMDVAIAANRPQPNSPSWTSYNGQALSTDSQEFVFVRLTDALGNRLFAIVDLNNQRVISTLPGDTILTGSAWWQILFRAPNVFLWVVPLILVFLGWGWFFFFIAKRRTREEEAPVQDPIETPRPLGRPTPAVVPAGSPRTVPPPPTKPISKKGVVAPPKVETPVVDEAIPAPPKPRRKRKPKLETYAQIVALEASGVMDDDLLGVEVMELNKKVIREVLTDELANGPDTPPFVVDQNQIDIFDFDDTAPTKPPVKKKKDT